jgi:anti-sigma factor RsiW
MSKHEVAHLQDDDLVRLLDGELPDREASKRRTHVEACWTCRTRLEELETTIGEYVRYREGMKPLLPDPPKAWVDLEPRFEQVDRSLAPPRLLIAARRTHLFGLRPVHWLAGAACLLVAFILIRRFERVPEVNAAELLRKASAAQANMVEPNLRITLKTSHRSITRTVSAMRATSEDVELRQMFEAASFSWDNPLSARSFASWREQLAEKTDKVEETDNSYVIRTTTSASTLRRATLTLRARDLRPVREMLEFTSDTVEITEAQSEDVAGPAPSPAPIGERESIHPPATVPNIAISPALRELQVFSALHRIGADLGEPVEIHRSGSQLSVIGTGLTAVRKEQLRAALSEIPGVEIRFDDGKATVGGGSSPGDRNAPATAPMQIRLQAMLGSRESAEEFTNRALDASDAVMAHVHALRAIARAFPTDVESGLAAADREVLTSLRADHRVALSQRIADLQRTLKPVLAGATAGGGTEGAVSWQSAAQVLFTAAQRFDQLLNAVLAGANSTGDDGDFERLTVALGRLEAQFAAYQKATR